VARNLLGEGDARVRAVAAQNLLRRNRQRRLLEQLAGAGILAQAVKGVGLVEGLYPDLSWREVHDIDLLVERSQVVSALEALRAAGLRPSQEWTPAGLSCQLARPLPLAPELLFTAPDGVLVELHWDWPESALPPSGLFERPEAYLVYLCRHAGKHFWSRLKWSCDIELFVRRFGERLDWNRFWRLAAGCGAERSCVVSLELCRRWFGGACVPGLEGRRNRRTERLASDAAAQLLNPEASASHPVWRQWRLLGWRQRPAFLRALFAPQPQEWNRAVQNRWSRAQVWTKRIRHLWERWAPHRARRLSAADLRILLEAYAAVAVAELARRLLPGGRLLTAAHRRTAGRGPRVQWSLPQLQRVAWLVNVAANRQPVTVRCLARSMALLWMLRHRGLDADLRIGFKRPEGGLEAHAWVEWQGYPLDDSVQETAGLLAVIAPVPDR
jgi:hypothetical protein